MINGHLINHYYIIELYNDLIGKNRFPQSDLLSDYKEGNLIEISTFTILAIGRLKSCITKPL